MTREEAIEVLKKIASYEDILEYFENHSVTVQDTCYMAIKALEIIDKYKAESGGREIYPFLKERQYDFRNKSKKPRKPSRCFIKENRQKPILYRC